MSGREWRYSQRVCARSFYRYKFGEECHQKVVVDEVNGILAQGLGEQKDLIGRVYEYLLKSFAVNASKEEGEFYTPHDVVELIAAFIEPYDGTLYDPCCGSGGMFVQCAKYVEEKGGDIAQINVYGQENDPATYRLAKMNLAVRGISHHLGERNASLLHQRPTQRTHL